MFFDSFVCSIRNLGRKRFRSFLTIASIAIGVASVVLIGSIGEIGKGAITDELNSLGLGSVTVSADKKFTSLKMGEEDLALLRKSPQVESATPIVVSYSSIRMRGLVANAVLWGVDDGKNQVISLTPKYGRMLDAADIAGAADVCVIDSNVAELFYKRDNVVGKSLDAMIGGSYVRLEIVGIASSGGNILQNMVGDVIPSFAYLPYTTVQRYTGEDSFGQIAVTLRDSADIDAAAEQLSASVNRFHNIERGFKAENISKQKDTLDNLLGVVTIVLSAIAAVSLVVAGLGIMTVMIVSVNERTREIGIRKALGAKERVILSQFVVEAATTSALGGVLGIVLGYIVSMAANRILPMISSSIDVTVSPSFNSIVVAFGISVGIGVLFGYLPAKRAARLNPIEALRYD